MIKWEYKVVQFELTEESQLALKNYRETMARRLEELESYGFFKTTFCSLPEIPDCPALIYKDIPIEEFGAEGWEFCGEIRNQLIFKRPIE